MSQDEELKIVQAHMAQLSEHFETVQIFVTIKKEESTTSMFDGCGNYFARYGQVKSWTIAEEKDFDAKNRVGGEEEEDG